MYFLNRQTHLFTSTYACVCVCACICIYLLITICVFTHTKLFVWFNIFMQVGYNFAIITLIKFNCNWISHNICLFFFLHQMKWKTHRWWNIEHCEHVRGHCGIPAREGKNKKKTIAKNNNLSELISLEYFRGNQKETHKQKQKRQRNQHVIKHLI